MSSRRSLLQFIAASIVTGACGPSRPPPKGAKPDNGQKKSPTRRGRGPADLIVHGRILTMDPDAREVEAVAITDGTITALGPAAKLLNHLKGEATQVLDLEGGIAVAGLTDAHAHLLGLGRDLEIIDLRGANSEEEVVRRVREGAPTGRFILGRGWDQNIWSKGQGAMPDNKLLSAAFPERPVWLIRIDGHAGWANKAALKEAGIGADTPDPEGGEILRASDGAATGVLVDNAMSMMPTPSISAADLRRRLLAAQQHALARGLTGVHEMGVSSLADGVFRELAKSGELQMRIHGYADSDWLAGALGERDPDPIRAEARYLLAGVKLYVDGALGSRGAALQAPYSDRQGHRGTLIQSPERLRELCDRALARGWQIASHAIGDRANHLILETYAAALAALPPGTGPGSQRRLRIEHAQIVDPADIPRFRELGLVASMQPTHATSDMPWVEDRIGAARLAGAYAWRRFLDEGVHMALGSDFPVEEVAPTLGLYAAISRQDADGKPPKGWLGEQRLTLSEALAGFSRGAAFAAHREEHLGTLRRGAQADLTCFVDDITTLEAVELRKAAIRATIIAGNIVWQA